jgi:homoserine dehydrogenase
VRITGNDATVRRWPVCLAGAGHVGGNFLALLHDRHDEIATRYGIDLRVTGVAEIGGCAIDPDGLDLATLLARLRAHEPVEATPAAGRIGLTARQMLAESEAVALLDATPVNLIDGEPGLGLVRAALHRGMHVVLADKGPLALAYPELNALSDLATGWGARYSGTPRGTVRGSGSARRWPARCR